MLRFSAKNTARRALLAITAMLAVPAFAHVDPSHGVMSFSAGLLHPLSGLDHLLAMVAVGLWAMQNRRPERWIVPVLFPLMMLGGAAAGMAGWMVPGTEDGIAASVVLLGLLIAFAVKMPAWASALVVSLFGLLHGAAHGSELPLGASAALYGAGFVLATAGLHLAGAMGGWLARDKAAYLVRLGGAAIAAAGVYCIAALA